MSCGKLVNAKQLSFNYFVPWHKWRCSDAASSIPPLLFRRVYKPRHRLRPPRRLSLKRVVLFQINLPTLAWFCTLGVFRDARKRVLWWWSEKTKKEQEVQTVDTWLVYHLSVVCLHRRLQSRTRDALTSFFSVVWSRVVTFVLSFVASA